MSLIKRHLEAFWFVASTIIPAILRFRKRPVIFARWGGAGDILCSFPAVPELIRRHPGRQQLFNCHPDFQCLPRLAGLPVQVTTTPHLGLVRFWYGWLVKQFYAFEYIDEVPGVTPVESLIQEFGRTHGVMVTGDHPRLATDPAAAASVEQILSRQGTPAGGRPRIVLHPGPSWQVKEWPVSAWSALVEQLRQHGCEAIFQLGVSKHLTLGAAPVALIPGTISLVDKLSLEETIALIAGADLFIGIDSGLLHIAASVSTPAVGVWGATSPRMLFSPADARFFVTSTVPCQGCQHRYPRLHWMTGCPHDIHCMKNIPVEPVLQACLQALQRGKP
jgi:ADP-heptose:LPS heptosyltransferase